LIYAAKLPELTNGTGAGTLRIAEFGDKYQKASLSEIVMRFAPYAVPELSEQKITFADPITKFVITYDKEGDYFRIQNPDRQMADLNGRQVNAPSNLKTREEIKDYIMQHTHFQNTDRR